MGIALITGASSGLGVEFAKLFAKDGHSLILVARRRDRLEQLSQLLTSQNSKIKIWVMEADLSKTGSGQDLMDKVSAQNLTVDFLVNNAGFGSNGFFADLPLSKELQMIDLNVRALLELTHLVLPDMLKKKSGRILNVGSTAGFQPGPYMATYYASKAFVNSLSEALNKELKGTGVSCTVLAPGPTQTEFAQTAGNDKSNLFKSGRAASASQVALDGYRAMMKGQALKIQGLLNWILVQGLRFSPRFIIRFVAARMNQV